MKIVDFDPVIFHLGPLQVRWYGLMYVVAFLIGGKLLAKLSKEKFFDVPLQKIDLFITYQLLGMFLGARLTYVFIYNWEYYSGHLLELFSVWQGGLSFHGAIIGFVIVNYFYGKKSKIPLFQITDSIALAGTQGLFFGRVGNFINGELYGRATELPWGLIFKDGGPYPRHPSQLYEAVAEGIILLIILWALKKRVKIYGIISSVFFIGYGTMRYFIEFFREPDSQLGYYLGGTTTMGQLLCLFMVLIGIFVFFYAKKVNTPIPHEARPTLKVK